jgi:AraC-like DNA-binding protein
MRNLLQKKYSLLMAVDDFSTDIKIEQTLGIKTEDDGREFLKKSIAFFEANIGNRDFVIEDLARHLGMSRTAYYNKMKSVTGLSPVDFVKQMRIKKALKLLENRSLSISDVAYKTGFSDPKYFSRCFKAEMGMTPTQYVSSLPADTLS